EEVEEEEKEHGVRHRQQLVQQVRARKGESAERECDAGDEARQGREPERPRKPVRGEGAQQEVKDDLPIECRNGGENEVEKRCRVKGAIARVAEKGLAAVEIRVPEGDTGGPDEF